MESGFEGTSLEAVKPVRRAEVIVRDVRNPKEGRKICFRLQATGREQN